MAEFRDIQERKSRLHLPFWLKCNRRLASLFGVVRVQGPKWIVGDAGLDVEQVPVAPFKSGAKAVVKERISRSTLASSSSSSLHLVPCLVPVFRLPLPMQEDGVGRLAVW